MKKKILALSLCVALLAVAVIGGTLAYFTDTDDAKNVFTVGNIDIALEETYIQDSKLMPGEENAVEKLVQVKVEAGSDDAYVWYEYLIPADLKDILHVGFNDSEKWSAAEAVGQEVVDGVTYDVYVSKYSDVLAAEEVTEVGMNAICLDAKVDFDNAEQQFILVSGGAITPFDMPDAKQVLVHAYGIQAATFADVDAAYAAFQAQWTAPAEEAPQQ